jgi:hypothetical protein
VDPWLQKVGEAVRALAVTADIWNDRPQRRHDLGFFKAAVAMHPWIWNPGGFGKINCTILQTIE